MFFRTRSREPASATPKPLDMVKERAVPAKTLFILGQEDHDLPEGERDVLGVDDDAGGAKSLRRFCRTADMSSTQR